MFFAYRGYNSRREAAIEKMKPISNKPVRVYDINYDRNFNDLNDVQLSVAQALGVPPVENREAAEKLKGKLVEVVPNGNYKIDNLSHSIPYLVPVAKDLLDMIGRNFADSLSSKGLNPSRFIVTSVLRTESDVRQLRKVNVNASENSCHRFGTTFDISWSKFDPVLTDDEGRKYEAPTEGQLKATLGQVLRDLKSLNYCYVKYEKKQACFHITVRG